jgi:hypothetical protein
MDRTRTNPTNGAIFAVNMLAATSGGDCYTLDEIREDLEWAGFRDVNLMRDGFDMDQLVRAEKPAQ